MHLIFNEQKNPSTLVIKPWNKIIQKKVLTIMSDNSVFSVQTELYLPLSDNFQCIWRQSLGVPGEHKGVAISTSAVCI